MNKSVKKDLQLITKNAIEYGQQFKGLGYIADYIPELASASAEDIALSIVANNKKVYNCGDTYKLFTMQSISKTISLILALKLAGRDKVFSKVWVEPSGDSFNSLVKLETKTHIPLNPMINAGAIVVVDIMLSHSDALKEFLSLTHKLCGRQDISYSEKVYVSEKLTGDKNRAIAYMLKSEGVLENEVEEVLDTYFKICAVEITTQDLAYYANILANNGLNIFTKEQIFESWIATTVKTIMVTCGMYDGSGEFAINIGVPAKSGVSGAIVACAEENMGIAVYSPQLDEKGNSVCGLKMLEYLSKQMKLHFFNGLSICEYE